MINLAGGETTGKFRLFDVSLRQRRRIETALKGDCIHEHAKLGVISVMRDLVDLPTTYVPPLEHAGRRPVPSTGHLPP
ncbi:MAG: hypothetical protein WAK82_17645 [Streptosporangiaceae bacterium]